MSPALLGGELAEPGQRGGEEGGAGEGGEGGGVTAPLHTHGKRPAYKHSTEGRYIDHVKRVF